MDVERAYAKLNLTLDVLGRREDGYHDLRMVMETVDLRDDLSFSPEGKGVWVRSNLGFLPEDSQNLAAKAALCFSRAAGWNVEPLLIRIKKRIPVCAGMGGGSSDAAAVLRYLNREMKARTGRELDQETLRGIGAQVGSDVPYCVMGGTALAEGRGEVLTPLPRLPKCLFVLCKPPFSVSTPALFGEIDRRRIKRRPDTAGVLKALEEGDLTQVARRLYNVFEDVLPDRQKKQVAEIKNSLVQMGALGACMSGTGSTVYGMFDDRDLAQRAYKTLKEDLQDTFLVSNV